MKCECGKLMIKRYENRVLMSNPPQYPWQWWCGCGKTKEGGIERGKTDGELALEKWKQVNKEGEG